MNENIGLQATKMNDKVATSLVDAARRISDDLDRMNEEIAAAILQITDVQHRTSQEIETRLQETMASVVEDRDRGINQRFDDLREEISRRHFLVLHVAARVETTQGNAREAFNIGMAMVDLGKEAGNEIAIAGGLQLIRNTILAIRRWISTPMMILLCARQ